MKDTRMSRRFTTILLDVDGTLLDFSQAESEGIRAVLAYRGFRPEPELMELYHNINESFWAAFERGEITKERLVTERFRVFFGQLGRETDGREEEDFYRQQLNQSAVLIPGAVELCEYLKDRYDLYVVTNGTSDTQYKRLKRSGLDKYMLDVFVSEDAGSQKPQKEYFDYCFSRIREKDPGKMLLIGDSLHSDIKGGNLAGISTCWYNPEGKEPADGIQADYEIRSLEEIRQEVMA